MPVWIYEALQNALNQSGCQNCDSKSNLQIHHKDHDHSHNTLDNLEVLCASCHWKIHHPNKLKEKNKRILTASRLNKARKLLLEGKSFDVALLKSRLPLSFDLHNPFFNPFLEGVYRKDGSFYFVESKKLIKEANRNACASSVS